MTEALSRQDALMEAADGMPTEEAVKYITHGREMEEVLHDNCRHCEYYTCESKCVYSSNIPCKTKALLAKLDKEDDNKCLAGLTQAEREREDTCGNGDCAHEANCTLI